MTECSMRWRVDSTRSGRAARRRSDAVVSWEDRVEAEFGSCQLLQRISSTQGAPDMAVQDTTARRHKVDC
jgi:hypothetical protein